MNHRYIRAVCFVLALLMMTIVSLPLRSLNIMASDTDLKQVTVVDNTQTKQYKTGAKTVGTFFKEQSIILRAKDQCDHLMTDKINDEMIITIKRGVNVYVSIDGIREKRRVSQGTTIERLLGTLQDENGIALMFDGDVNREVAESDIISFATWQNRWNTVTETIPFETHEIDTTALRQGVTKVRQEGVPGEKQVTTAHIYIGGVERRQEVTEEIITAEPIPEIIDIGIGGALGTTADTTSPSFDYIQKLTMNASAYTAGYESTGKNPGDPGYGITRSGLTVRKGIVSVDPRVIPLGTLLYVEGYGYSLAADTGSAIVGNMIDLYFESLDDALRFGRRNLNVYILG